MRKIEKEMLNAIKNSCDYWKSNTRVCTNRKGDAIVFLYETIIFAQIKGIKYFSDGGYNTCTTSSRLRALGENYSINKEKNECKLETQKFMRSLYKEFINNFK